MRGCKPWTTQPPAGTPIDWSNPLADGLIFVYVPNNCGFDLVSGETGTAVAGVATPLRAGAAGVTGDWKATSSLAYANNGYFNPPTVSLMAYVRGNAAPATNTGILSKPFDGNATLPSYGLVLNYSDNDDICFSIRQAGGQSGPSFAYTPPANESVVLMGTYNGAEAALYAAGVLLAQKAVTGAPQSGTGAGNSLIVSGSSDSAVATAFSGDIYCGAVWKRGLLGSEVERLSANPWQLFLPPRRRVYSLPASTSDSGSAAITESADIVSATGALSVAGTAAITEQPDTVSAIGALSVSGTASITEGSDTVSATGTLSVAGVAAIFEGGDIVAASGAIAIAGSAAITEADDTVGASGYGGTVVQGASVLSPVAIRQSTLSLAIRQSTLTVIQ